MATFNKRGRSRRTMNEINMVPFIDVMLVLLIIFMVTAPLITPSTIELPSVGQASRRPDKVIEVIVKKDASLSIKAEKKNIPVRLEGLAQAVVDTANANRSTRDGTANNDPERAFAVVISADRAVKYDAVVQVMDALKKAGIARVALSVSASR
ncbi:MAG: ExbD/TolR family protein [Burkholderiaceae bacterium]|jgi:biopolymer transport protein TolR|nr:ExbD/TolR family protein [Burkholderiaceae bacterium]MDP4863663.1 ExbD/TolR family protein [Burkholderiaceae bacterium]